MATEDPSLPKPRILYCLDFDGVLCDSVHETFLSGWRACQLLWDAHSDDENQGKMEWINNFQRNPELLVPLEEDFRFVRPILHTGWEAILLIRLLATAYTTQPVDPEVREATRLAVFLRFNNLQNTKTTPAESTSEALKAIPDDQTFRSFCLDTWGRSIEDYKAGLAEARTSWIQNEEASWIDAHGFFEGACRAVREYLQAEGNSDVYVITTKAKEFALRLLEKQDLYSFQETLPHHFFESHVFGLGSGPKATVLQQILETRQQQQQQQQQTNEQETLAAVMVEDNLSTLRQISSSPVASKVLPVVAPWGYNSVQQLASDLWQSEGKTGQPSWIFLPPLRPQVSVCRDADAVRARAQRYKERDPTGCSLAAILQTPAHAGRLVRGLEAPDEKAVANEEDLYDFSSEESLAKARFVTFFQELPTMR